MMDETTIGVVISTFEGPSPHSLSFVVKSRQPVPVRKDQFISIDVEDGQLICRVVNMRKTNRYYARAESVKEYESKQGASMDGIFPVDSWEFLVADVLPLGVYSDGGKIKRSTFPAGPGTPVRIASPQVLSSFLGFDASGLELGEVEHHDLVARLNMTRLLQKHLAILALSGAGKSHTVSVIIEELLERKKESGRTGILVMDIHGEYTSFASPQGAYGERTAVLDGKDIRIAVPSLSAGTIGEFLPKMSPVQQRDLSRIVDKVRASNRSAGNTYDLKDLIKAVEDSEDVNDATKRALGSWLYELDSTGLFGPEARPKVEFIVEPGRLTVVDLSTIGGLRNKQILVAYLSRKLFNLRKAGRICPYVEVIEEAHNFAPEGVKYEAAISRNILETIAREGRKFYASLCLISQRPIRLSTTVLSQCNTNLILRVTNPYDLDHIGKSCEGITRETLDSITTLQVGEGLVVGEAVNHPVFIKIRDRKSAPPSHSVKLEEAARRFELKGAQEAEDADAFM